MTPSEANGPVSGEAPSASQSGALIIPFPVRPNALQDPQARLAHALDSLHAALNSQREAMAAWRMVLKDLRATTADLDDSLRRYRSSLCSLTNGVAALRSKAKTLEAWADGVTPAGQ